MGAHQAFLALQGLSNVFAKVDLSHVARVDGGDHSRGQGVVTEDLPFEDAHHVVMSRTCTAFAPDRMIKAEARCYVQGLSDGAYTLADRDGDGVQWPALAVLFDSVLGGVNLTLPTAKAGGFSLRRR